MLFMIKKFIIKTFLSSPSPLPVCDLVTNTAKYLLSMNTLTVVAIIFETIGLEKAINFSNNKIISIAAVS